MGWMKCFLCGSGYDGHHRSRYCDVCKPLVLSGHRAKWVEVNDGVVGAYGRWKASVLRDRVNKRAFANRDLIRLGEVEFNSVVGVCGYCGEPGFGLCKRDLDGVWELGNVVCCCGLCGGMKRGLSHDGFILQMRRVLGNLGV